MINRTTLARPYARAAFEVARQAATLDQWSSSLALASATAASDEVRQFSGDPRVAREQLLKLLVDVGEGRFDDQFVNFLKVLLTYGRLDLLPEIAAQYEFLRREAEARIRVQVASAMPMSEQQTEVLTQRLKSRFGREVELEIEIDPDLIGGAVIRAGDLVIDGSVRGRLEQLGRSLGR